MDKVENVLISFVSARPDVGYIQGMGFIAAVMMLVLEEVECFIRFTNLVTSPSLIGFYLMDEHQINLRLQLHANIFRESLPKLSEHFGKEGIFPNMYFFEWLLTLYSNVLSLRYVFRIWDLMFTIEGPIVIFKTAVVLLAHLEK